MILKTILLVFGYSLALGVHAQDSLNNNDIPVTLRDLKYVVIDNYHGSMNTKTVELFDKVETLKLQNCNFTYFDENYLHSLKNLQKLIIAYSHFNKVNGNISSCCKKLREVEVYSSHFGTPISEEDFEDVVSWKALERLYFFRMDVPVLHSKAFAGSNMKTIEIEYSNLATIEDGAFDGLDKLEVLNLQHNKLSKVPTKDLASLKNLKELNLRGNLLVKITTEDIPSLPNLEKINLGHNPIKEIELKGLKEKLPKLKEVDVSEIDIDPSKNEGVPLVKLRIL